MRSRRWLYVGGLIALILVGGQGVAQAPPAVAVGAKIGPVVSDQTYEFNDNTLEFDPRSSIGAALGVYVDWRWSTSGNGYSGVSGRLDLLYIRKGSEVKVRSSSYLAPQGSSGDTLQLKDEIDYLSISPGVKLQAAIGPGGPYALVAPRLDIKLGGDSELNAVASDGLESIIWGATVGVGYELPVGNGRSLSLEGVYHLDFTDAYDLSRTTVQNRAVVILLGITI